MSNDQQAAEQLKSALEAEKGEKSPESGVQEKIKAPESFTEAKDLVAKQAENRTNEARNLSGEILKNEQPDDAYEAAKEPIDKATVEAIQLVTLAADAKLELTGGAQAAETPAKVEQPAVVEAQAEVPMPPEAAEQGSGEKKEGEGDPFAGITSKFDAIIAEYKAAGLKADAGLLRRMQKLLVEAHPDRHPGDARYAQAASMMGRLLAAMKGDIRSWSSPRGVNFENDYAEMKRTLSGEAAPAAEAPVAKTVLEEAGIPKGEAANDNVQGQAPAEEEIPVTHEEPEKTKEKAPADADDGSIDVDFEDNGSTEVDLEGMDAEDYEKYMLANIKGREMRLDALYAIPAEKRTPEQEYEIDDTELLNGMERKSIDKRKEEEKLKGLQARAAQLESEIMALGTPEAAAASPAEGALLLPPAAGLVLHEEAPLALPGREAAQKEDALALKRLQLAELQKTIGLSLATVAELGAAIAQLDGIRKRLPKPTAEGATGLAALKKAEAPQAAAAAVAAKGGGVSADNIVYGQPPAKAENGPDTDIVAGIIEAAHGNFGNLAKDVKIKTDAISKKLGG